MVMDSLNQLVPQSSSQSLLPESAWDIPSVFGFPVATS